MNPPSTQLTSLINLVAYATFENLSSQPIPTPTPTDYYSVYQQLHNQLLSTGLPDQKKQSASPTYTLSEPSPSESIKEPVLDGHPPRCHCASCERERKRQHRRNRCRGQDIDSNRPDIEKFLDLCDPVEDGRRRQQVHQLEVRQRQEREARQRVALWEAQALAEVEEEWRDERLQVEALERRSAVWKQALPGRFIVYVAPTSVVTSMSQDVRSMQIMSRRDKRRAKKEARKGV